MAIKRSELEKSLTASGYTTRRKDAERAVDIALSNLSSTFTEAELFRKLRGSGFAKAADMAQTLYPFAVEERARRRDPSYISEGSVQKLADATAGLRRMLDRTSVPAAKTPYITKSFGKPAPGWHITDAQYDRCVKALLREHPAMTRQTAEHMMDTIMLSGGPAGWEAELAD